MEFELIVLEKVHASKQVDATCLLMGLLILEKRQDLVVIKSVVINFGSHRHLANLMLSNVCINFCYDVCHRKAKLRELIYVIRIDR